MERNLTKGEIMYPLAVIRGMRRWGNDFARYLRMSASAHTWEGKLSSPTGIRWEQRPRGMIGNLWMLKSGIYLDSMRPHIVALKKGRKITRWARDKGIFTKHLFVRPHPFIDRIYSKHKPKLIPYVKQEINREKSK